MDYIKDPNEIERRSMALIAPYLTGMDFDEQQVKIVSRVIHAAGDPDYANHVQIHPDAVEAASAAIRRGADVYCDVEMVRTGISKKTLAQYGGQVLGLRVRVCASGSARQAAGAGAGPLPWK